MVGNALATAFVRFSDFYGGAVFDSVIRDYTTGTNIDFYNDIGWTESVRVDNVMSRTSKRGIWFHSNPASTDWQTLSFFGAVIENFGFQHGIGGASYGITVGDGSRADNLYNCKIDMTGWWEHGGTVLLCMLTIRRLSMVRLLSVMTALLQALWPPLPSQLV